MKMEQARKNCIIKELPSDEYEGKKSAKEIQLCWNKFATNC